MNHKKGSIFPKIYTFLYRSYLGLKVLEVAKAFLLLLNFYSDFKRYLKWSSANRTIGTQTNLRALITMDYHRLEKGLSLKNPRVGFGKDAIERLSNLLPEYQNKYGSDETVTITLNALQEYYDFNLKHGLDHENAYQTISQVKSNLPKNGCLSGEEGGTKTVNKNAIKEAAKVDFKSFVMSRYSVRQFTDEDVDISLIEEAVRMAQKTPSVCNRQSCRVYTFSQEKQKQKVLSCQNGNRGFGDQASQVLIVTSNLEHFTSLGERYQGWIDGGMFSMSLVYALHSLGVGTCCLNWSVKSKQDKKLKMTAGIPDSDLVIMMIAVGHLPEEFKVAQSPRKPLKEVLITDDNRPDSDCV